MRGVLVVVGWAIAAWAGRAVEPLLPAHTCASDDPANRALARRRAEDEWRAIGFPAGTTGLAVAPVTTCCAALAAEPVDDARRPLGTLWLNSDCTVLGWEVAADSGRGAMGRWHAVGAHWIEPVDPAPGPPTAASALVAAWTAVRDRPDALGDTLYAVPSRRGWDVWLTRWWGVDALTTAVVRVEAGQVVRVRPLIRPWVLPDEVDAARAAETFPSDPERRR